MDATPDSSVERAAPRVIHRVGVGTDLHRLEPGRRLVLAGVEIPFDRGPAGHSDADVVLHAVIDAVSGAAGLPDIGEQFPDSDPEFRGADSAALLARVMERVAARGFEVVNVDVVVHAERPKLSAHKSAMQARLARLLGVRPQDVSVKAKTNEGLDAVGRGEAIACTVVAGLARRGIGEP